MLCKSTTSSNKTLGKSHKLLGKSRLDEYFPKSEDTLLFLRLKFLRTASFYHSECL